jgi:FADH2 O2-dependent halogenase
LRKRFDLAIVGSGFAGSLTAMIARRLGRSVILLERGKHPRFAIGESSTPLANLLLEEIAERYDLPAIRPLSKWGTWQQACPELPCGLKRGFTFYHHVLGQPDAPDPEHKRQLLVAASPHDRIADTHWYRADFDDFLLRQAQKLGAEYLDETVMQSVVLLPDAVELNGARHGHSVSIEAEFLVDASGPRGFLHRMLGLPEERFPDYPATQALYSHFSGVKRRDAIAPEKEMPPYPVEDAAVHHIFSGGWVWMLRFNNGRVSAGVAATEKLATELQLHQGEAAWHRLLERLPSLQAQFAAARCEETFYYTPRLAFLSGVMHGERWAMLPSAAGFVDPLLSTGFPLTLLGVLRLAEIFAECSRTPSARQAMLQDYAERTYAELHATARLIAALYANMDCFEVFSALSLLYFAAASYSETARRLQKPELAQSFLLYDRPDFGPKCEEILKRARGPASEEEKAALVQDVLRAIEPLDVAGLCRTDRRNWYPVEAEDLLRAASKVEASKDEIVALLRRSGFEALPL